MGMRKVKQNGVNPPLCPNVLCPTVSFYPNEGAEEGQPEPSCLYCKVMHFYQRQTPCHKDHSRVAWRTVAEWQMRQVLLPGSYWAVHTYSGQLKICINQSGGQHRKQLLFPLGMSWFGPWVQVIPTCGVLAQQTAGPEVPGDSWHTPFFGSFRKAPVKQKKPTYLALCDPWREPQALVKPTKYLHLSKTHCFFPQKCCEKRHTLLTRRAIVPETAVDAGMTELHPSN